MPRGRHSPPRSTLRGTLYYRQYYPVVQPPKLHLRHSCHRPILFLQCDRGAAWTSGLYHGVAHRARAAFGFHPELARWPHQGQWGRWAGGERGAISVFATNDTDLILDTNGYFVPATTPSALAFYPMAPCPLVDTHINLLSSGL